MKTTTTQERPEWVLVDTKPVPGTTDDVIRVLHWPHENARGGNHPGEYWVCRVVKTPTFETTVDNAYYWGSEARKRALQDFHKRA